jgi:lipoyl-dependent peroxiredoxin
LNLCAAEDDIMDRGAVAIWSHPGMNGGTLTTDSGALTNVPCSSVARYELEASPTATTPEELLAAAYAACFTMTFAERLSSAGHPVHSLRTEVRVQLIKPSGHWEIPAVRVHCSATIPSIGESEFLAIAHAARVEGAVARAMRAEVTVTVSLESAPGHQWRVAPEGARPVA